MSARLISNPRYVLLVGLISVGGLVTIISQPADFEAAPMATRSGPHEASKSVSVHAAKTNMSAIGNRAANGKNQASDADDNALWSVPLTSLTAMRERPIFSPTRRPPPAFVKSAPAQVPSPTGQPLLALIGAIANEDEGIGIFLDGITKAIIRMKTGESHAGWTLQAVKAREVILQNEQKTTVLVLPSPPAK